MLGAIIGDIVGSRFEFNNIKSKDFTLFDNNCFFTDDTVMTCAVACSLISNMPIERAMRMFGKLYPDKSYGAHFRRWLFSKEPKPYGSCGNGSAMRISPVAYVAKSEEEVVSLARQVTEVTHNHPQGIKGAIVTALCIYKALHGASKEDIAAYVVREYPEMIAYSYDKLVNNYIFNGTCQGSVPQAIYCFLISNDFEDCLRTTVSIGGDSDTLCAISGAIAEAFYGIPEELKKQAMNYFTERDKDILLRPIEIIYMKNK